MISLFLLIIAFYVWHTACVTIGLHRLLSHKSFRCPKFFEYFLVLSAYLGFHGAPIWWATMHRAHHRHVDTPLDPHAPKNGLWDAYAFFAPFKYADHIDPHQLSSDIINDPVYSFLECRGNWKVGYVLCIGICILFRVVLFAAFGWQVALASTIGGIIALNTPLILNVVCHIPRLGYRTYDTKDDSVNVWWMAVLCLGEGWHNNHHQFPGSARIGIGPDEFDISWEALKLCKKIGLVSSLNEPNNLQKARIPVALEK